MKMRIIFLFNANFIVLYANFDALNLINLLLYKHSTCKISIDFNVPWKYLVMLTKVWQKFDFRLDICRIITGAYIEHLKEKRS